MLKAKISDNSRALTVISGTQFVELGHPLSFIINSVPEVADEIPITLTLTIADNSEKADLLVETSDLVDRKLTVSFFNPPSGTSGLINPIGILQSATHRVFLMFHIERLTESNYMRLTYDLFMTNRN